MSQLGGRIKEQRIKQKWTQDVLAQKIGASKHVISNWERGVANPDYKQIVLLCNALSVSADYLLGITELPVPYYKDPFGQLFFLPHVDYSFVKERAWDLLKLIDSGIVLSVNKEELTSKDKILLHEVISSIVSRLHEVTRGTEERTKELLTKQFSDEPSSDNSLF
ncbi:helix-turn-helix transcriptional regulator [Brevibacillus fortis]|nr:MULTISPECIES: helix-turn-helix transcriptional regulator [Brevibacillus]MED1785733.1 helix-turn-helix transcriptional regulator [Brevibacillus fortis]